MYCTIPVWKPDELRQVLMSTLEKLYRQEPDSLPFRQPVDAMLLNIPVSVWSYPCHQKITALGICWCTHATLTLSTHTHAPASFYCLYIYTPVKCHDKHVLAAAYID